jgi:hypothetical protein
MYRACPDVSTGFCGLYHVSTKGYDVPPPCYKISRELSRIDKTIEDSITSCYPRSWDEDHISYSWLKAMLGLGHSISVPQTLGLSIKWDAYKQNGTLEENNGDIAFLVNLIFPNGNELTGVGFLEAKRAYESGKYEALKWEQLRRMNTNSTSHQLLLYDFEPQTPSFFYAGGCCWDGSCRLCCDRKSSALVTPTVHALAYEKKDRSLAAIGYRLSEQIFFRYFRGLDLNFDNELVQNVKKGISGGIKFLAVASVAVGASEGFEHSLEKVRPNENSGFRSIQS